MAGDFLIGTGDAGLLLEVAEREITQSKMKTVVLLNIDSVYYKVSHHDAIIVKNTSPLTAYLNSPRNYRLTGTETLANFFLVCL